MGKMLTIHLGVALILCFAATVSAQTGADDRQYARIKADLDVVREDQRRLYGLIQDMQNSMAAVTIQLERLERRLEGASADTGDPVARKQISALRSALEAETRARKTAIDRVVTQVSDEIERMVKTLAAARGGSATSVGGGQGANDSASESGWNGAVQGEYTVVAGDTLSTIAQAFGVSTKLLMRANKLNNDIIRVGQVLIIPQP